jgi:hypothetical protein
MVVSCISVTRHEESPANTVTAEIPRVPTVEIFIPTSNSGRKVGG